jgi:hypothetical protein
MCSQIAIAVAVAKAAGRFIGDTMTVILVPITNAVSAFVVWAIGLTGMIWLVAAADWKIVNSTDIMTSFSSYTDPALLRLYYFFFGVLWVDALVSAYSFFIIASACALWYYSTE